ncbi:MAG: hypothetical protein V3S69_02330 [Dehalococcoidales bacterium]
MARMSKSDAVRNREESHAGTKINLEMTLESLQKTIDWEESWPNNITNLTQNLQSHYNGLRILLRSIEPVESDGHVRVLPGPVMRTEDYDTAERNVVVIGDD